MPEALPSATGAEACRPVVRRSGPPVRCPCRRAAGSSAWCRSSWKEPGEWPERRQPGAGKSRGRFGGGEGIPPGRRPSPSRIRRRVRCEPSVTSRSPCPRSGAGTSTRNPPARRSRPRDAEPLDGPEQRRPGRPSTPARTRDGPPAAPRRSPTRRHAGASPGPDRTSSVRDLRVCRGRPCRRRTPPSGSAGFRRPSQPPAGGPERLPRDVRFRTTNRKVDFVEFRKRPSRGNSGKPATTSHAADSPFAFR